MDAIVLADGRAGPPSACARKHTVPFWARAHSTGATGQGALADESAAKTTSELAGTLATTCFTIRKRKRAKSTAERKVLRRSGRRLSGARIGAQAHRNPRPACPGTGSERSRASKARGWPRAHAARQLPSRVSRKPTRSASRAAAGQPCARRRRRCSAAANVRSAGMLFLLARTQERASRIAPALRSAGAEVVEARDAARRARRARAARPGRVALSVERLGRRRSVRTSKRAARRRPPAAGRRDGNRRQPRPRANAISRPTPCPAKCRRRRIRANRYATRLGADRNVMNLSTLLRAPSSISMPKRPRRLRGSDAMRGARPGNARQRRRASYNRCSSPRDGQPRGERSASIAGIARLSVEEAVAEARALALLGIRAVLLFGIPASKDAVAFVELRSRRDHSGARARALKATQFPTCS